MSLANTFLILVAGIHLGVSTIVLLRNPKDKINSFFALSILFLSLWVASTSFFRSVNDHANAQAWYQFKLIFGLMISWSFQFFSLFFPYQNKIKFPKLKQILLAIPILTGIFIIIFFPRYTINEIVLQPENNLAFVNKYFWLLYSFGFVVNFIAAFFRLALRWIKQEGFLKFQLGSVILSVAIPLGLSLVFNIIFLFFDIFINDWIGALLTVIFSFLCFYFVFLCANKQGFTNNMEI